MASLDVSTRGVAILDPLTGLPNRLALRARAAELEYQSRVNGRPVALIVCDPDRFKAVNDEHGHAVGDDVLRQVGARIRAVLQAGAGAYRLGGEEFVLLVGDADARAGAELAERLRTEIAASPLAGLQMAVSLGVAASAPGEPFVFSRLFGLADRALYEAKGAGGDRVCVAPGTHEHAHLNGQGATDGAQANGARSKDERALATATSAATEPGAPGNGNGGGGGATAPRSSMAPPAGTSTAPPPRRPATAGPGGTPRSTPPPATGSSPTTSSGGSCWS